MYIIVYWYKYIASTYVCIQHHIYIITSIFIHIMIPVYMRLLIHNTSVIMNYRTVPNKFLLAILTTIWYRGHANACTHYVHCPSFPLILSHRQRHRQSHRHLDTDRDSSTDTETHPDWETCTQKDTHIDTDNNTDADNDIDIDILTILGSFKIGHKREPEAVRDVERFT